jgi:hypothetical protein
MWRLFSFLFGRRSELEHPHRKDSECADEERLTKKHARGPQNAWAVEVDVYLNSVAKDGTADFDVQTCLPTKMVGSDLHPEIQFHNEGRPGFFIRFRLFDNTGNGNYQFASNEDDAVWSQLGTTCPLSSVHGVFDKKKTVLEDATTLFVFNPNEDPYLGPFRYTLNVSTDGAPNYVHLDPGGNNMDSISRRWD